MMVMTIMIAHCYNPSRNTRHLSAASLMIQDWVVILLDF